MRSPQKHSYCRQAIGPDTITPITVPAGYFMW